MKPYLLARVSSSRQVRHKRFLIGRLDSFGAVVGADPGDGLVRRVAAQDGEAGQSRSGASVASEATDLHSFPGTSPGEHGSQSSDNLSRIVRDAEVRPVEVIVGPRRLPPV